MATSTLFLTYVNQNNIIMYLFTPLIAFFIFIILKMFGVFKW